MTEQLTPQPFSGNNGIYQNDWTLADARQILWDLHREFPFADWEEEAAMKGPVRKSRSLAVQIAAMLSQFAPGCIPRDANRMGFVYNANCQRSGKSLLAKLAVIPVYGLLKTQSWNTKDEELRKVLDSEVLAASSYVLFDNVRGFVSSPTLEGFMTGATWAGRILGRSQMFEASNDVTVFFTGNELILSSDLCHRCLFCELFVPEADVQERRPPDLVLDEHWLKDKPHRREILSALWTIVRHWSAAGNPTASHYGLKPRAGFEAWGEAIGGMVYFAGFGDCLEMPELVSGGDSEWEGVKALVVKLRSIVVENNRHEQAFTFQEIVDLCASEGILEWKMVGKEEEDEDGWHFNLNSSGKTSFGRFLSKWAPGKGQFRNYNLADGHKVTFRSTGEHRQKRFILALAD
ncbi:MAG: hypothetical protein LBH01_01070 [Verrucomicrobiales bacterium]|jgi:hypothetical protein|nr:hypothetical protein [Verrucomicrobiales bacterium]